MEEEREDGRRERGAAGYVYCVKGKRSRMREEGEEEKCGFLIGCLNAYLFRFEI